MVKKVFAVTPVDLSIEGILKMARENVKVRQMVIANIIFQGSTIPILIEKVPIFKHEEIGSNEVTIFRLNHSLILFYDIG